MPVCLLTARGSLICRGSFCERERTSHPSSLEQGHPAPGGAAPVGVNSAACRVMSGSGMRASSGGWCTKSRAVVSKIWINVDRNKQVDLRGYSFDLGYIHIRFVDSGPGRRHLVKKIGSVYVFTAQNYFESVSFVFGCISRAGLLDPVGRPGLSQLPLSAATRRHPPLPSAFDEHSGRTGRPRNRNRPPYAT